MCSDGKNYVKAAFRDPKKGCQHEEVCDFPGLKDKQPLECLTGKDANNPFPLIFDGGDFKFDANALDGSEPDRTVVKVGGCWH